MDSRQIQPGGVDRGQRGSNSGQIKADIDQTRERIDDTLDALADKLHPKHLLDEAVDYIRSPGQVTGAAGKLGQTIWHQIQEHPMPSLLIGAGIAWMLSEGKKSADIPPPERGGVGGSRRGWRRMGRRGDLRLFGTERGNEFQYWPEDGGTRPQRQSEDKRTRA